MDEEQQKWPDYIANLVPFTSLLVTSISVYVRRDFPIDAITTRKKRKGGFL